MRAMTLREWGAVAHRALADVYGWSPVPPRAVTFGFNNLVSSVAALLTAWDPARDPARDAKAVEAAASFVHEGWSANYVFWRDHRPWVPLSPTVTLASRDDAEFVRPHYPLGDARRDACAASTYADLPEAEKEKDRIVARAVLRALYA